jgi:hypothetical protein
MNIERITAGYLPGLREDEVQWHVLPFARDGVRLEVRVPVLTAAQMHALAAHVRQAADRHLRAMPVAEIIDAIDRAIARLLDRSDPCRRQAEAWLPVVSGYDADMVRLGLTGFFKTFRAAQLRRFVAEDFANPAVLDGFQPAPKGGAVRAFGPDLLMHSWAGNVPALSLWSLSAACWSRRPPSASWPVPSRCSRAGSHGCWPRCTRRWPIAWPWCGGAVRAVRMAMPPPRSMPRPTPCWPMAATTRCMRCASGCP